VQLNDFAMIEDHPSLTLAFIELAIVQTKLEQVNSNHTRQEFSLLNELLNEYLAHLDMVNCAFNERAKLHKRYLLSVDALQKTMIKVGNSSKAYDHIFIDKWCTLHTFNLFEGNFGTYEDYSRTT
jgi:hypothetical protein